MPLVGATDPGYWVQIPPGRMLTKITRRRRISWGDWRDLRKQSRCEPPQAFRGARGAAATEPARTTGRLAGCAVAQAGRNIRGGLCERKMGFACRRAVLLGRGLTGRFG